MPSRGPRTKERRAVIGMSWILQRETRRLFIESFINGNNIVTEVRCIEAQRCHMMGDCVSPKRAAKPSPMTLGKS